MSSNSAVAEVSSSGLITAKAQGSATITASTNGADSVICTVSVGSRSLSLNAIQYYQDYDGNLQLWYSGVQPTGTTYTWSSSNTSIATVAASGMLQFHGIGAVDITVTASTGDTATKTFYGIYPDGVYKLQNWSTKLYATLDIGLGLITEDVNLIQYGNGGSSRRQLWRVHYLGNGEYSIRSMVNPALVMAMDSEGNVQRNVQGYNLGTMESSLPNRAKWSFRGSTYYIFVESIASNTIYRLAVPSGNTDNFSNVYAITSEGSGTYYWTLIPIDESFEGMELYSGTSMVNGANTSMIIRDTKQLTAIYYTSGANISQDFTWTSSNNAVATVDSTGKITANSAGITSITALHIESGMEQSINIRVLPFDYGVYYFTAPGRNKHMQPDNNGDSHIELHSFDGTAEQKWILIHSYDGYYKIQNSATGLYLTAPVNADDEDGVIHENANSTNEDRQLWLFTEISDSIYKVQSKSFINTNLVLSVGVGINADGLNVELRNYSHDTSDYHEWYIRSYGYTINVEVIYDEAYLDRYSDAVARINTATSILNQRFLEEFGINIECTSPAVFTSYADQCPASYNDLCSCADTDDCDNSYISSVAIISGTHHHKNITNIIARIPKPNGPERFKLAYIGHQTCYVSGDDHWAQPFNGYAVSDMGIAAIMNFDSNSQNNSVTTIHEFGHLLGAKDHYGGTELSTEEINEEYGVNIYSEYCVYGEKRYEGDLPQELTICEGCRQTILDNISG